MALNLLTVLCCHLKFCHIYSIYIYVINHATTCNQADRGTVRKHGNGLNVLVRCLHGRENMALMALKLWQNW